MFHLMTLFSGQPYDLGLGSKAHAVAHEIAKAQVEQAKK